MFSQFVVNYLILFLTILLVWVSYAECYGISENLKQLQIIKESMDRTVDPCEDFHGYACGNWPKVHARQRYTGMGNYLLLKHVQEMTKLIYSKYPVQNITDLPGQSFIDKTVIYAQSCFQVGNENVLKYLGEIKPSHGLEWPLVEEAQAYRSEGKENRARPWPARRFDVFALLGQLNSYGFTNALIKQTTVRLVGRIVTVLALPDMNKIATEDVKSMLDDMELPEEVAGRYVKGMLTIHRELQSVYEEYSKVDEYDGNTEEAGDEAEVQGEDYEDDTPARTNRDIVEDIDNTFSYAELNARFPELYTFLDNLMPPHLREDDAVVVIGNLNYFLYLLSHKWQADDELPQICNYLMVQFLLHLQAVNRPGCMVTVHFRMRLAFDYLYYQHFYQPQLQELNSDLSNLTGKIYRQFLETFSENHLNMSHEQLQTATERLHNMIINLGNLPENVDRDIMEAFYRHVPDLDITNYYGNDLELLKQHTWESLTTDTSPMNFSLELKYSPSNLYRQNVVVVPFSFLMTPVYNVKLDHLFTLSTFGSTLGHEFTHAIDPDSLTTTSIYGSIFENILEQPCVKSALECLQHRQPTEFIDERIADLMGARVAYRAYSNTEQLLQPQFTKTPWQQLFFLNMAQFFCTKKTDGVISHDSSRTRLHQIAMNLNEFAEAFKCPLGSEMNPARKCRFF